MHVIAHIKGIEERNCAWPSLWTQTKEKHYCQNVTCTHCEKFPVTRNGQEFAPSNKGHL